MICVPQKLDLSRQPRRITSRAGRVPTAYLSSEWCPQIADTVLPSHSSGEASQQRPTPQAIARTGRRGRKRYFGHHKDGERLHIRGNPLLQLGMHVPQIGQAHVTFQQRSFDGKGRAAYAT